ncbi:hypothetical protein CRE_29101 [Caenorhabditis remanei]|uniref:Uncharacterized protein n=1 Tax=Caenorhabditis remanei TaxID=31234 RepID=E3N4I8_CAERE|nr:hypothetical protein CRE_29101 [Caenorhabditis remanei]
MPSHSPIYKSTRHSSRVRRVINRDYSPPAAWGRRTTSSLQALASTPPAATVAVQPLPIAAPVAIVAPAGSSTPRRSFRAAPRHIMRDYSPPGVVGRRSRVTGASPRQQNKGRSVSPQPATVVIQPPLVAAPPAAGAHTRRRSSRAPRPIMRNYSPPGAVARRQRVAAGALRRQNRGRSVSPRTARRALAARPRAWSVGGRRRVTFAAQLTQIRLIPHRSDDEHQNDHQQIVCGTPIPMVRRPETTRSIGSVPPVPIIPDVFEIIGNFFNNLFGRH